MSFYSPKPVLKAYQDHKRPEYMYDKNRLPSIPSGILKLPGIPEEKFTKSLIPFLKHKDVKEVEYQHLIGSFNFSFT